VKKVAIIAMHCHLRPPDAIAVATKHLMRLRIWAADKFNAVSFRVAVRRYVIAD